MKNFNAWDWICFVVGALNIISSLLVFAIEKDFYRLLVNLTLGLYLVMSRNW